MLPNNQPTSYRLRELDVQVTNRCPLTCRHCCCNSGPAQHAGASTEALLTLFREAKDLGVDAVHLTGGEPLLRKDLPQLVGALHALSLDVEIQSSWIEHENLKQHFPASDRDDIAVISLDGLKYCHDYYRGQGSYEKVTVRLRSLIAEGRRVRVNTILTRRNRADIGPLLHYTGRLGVEIHAVFYFSPIGRGKIIREEWLPPNEMSEVIGNIYKFINDCRAKLPPVIYLQPGYRLNKDSIIESLPCRMTPRDFIFVLSDGRTIPCSWYIDTDVTCGNVFSDGLRAVYDQFLMFVDEAEARLRSCSSCARFTDCQGGCDAARLLAMGDCDPRCTDPQRMFPGCPERKVLVNAV